MHILVTNNDGTASPWLLALADAMRNFADVSILAPDRDWSGKGHVKTLHQPLRVSDATLDDDTKAYTSDGAPSDCIALDLSGYISLEVIFPPVSRKRGQILVPWRVVMCSRLLCNYFLPLTIRLTT